MKLLSEINKWDDRPIGVFDSGLGGLTVVKQIKKLLPNENIVYLGDTARVPYGTRSKSVVEKFSLDDANFLLTQNVKIIVIACNTASALAAITLKNKLNIPVFEVISGASIHAANLTKNKKIGVIGTRGTIESSAYEKKIKLFNKHIKVFSKACPLFVPFIEEGEIKGKVLQSVVDNYLRDIKAERVDTLVLGCTHYPIIKDLIQKSMLGTNVTLVDPGIVEAKNILEYLTKQSALNNQKRVGKTNYYVTDITKRFKGVAEMFLGAKIHGSLKKVVID